MRQREEKKKHAEMGDKINRIIIAIVIKKNNKELEVTPFLEFNFYLDTFFPPMIPCEQISYGNARTLAE